VRGLMVILGAPSGAGKSTLVGKVRAQDPRLAFSVSHTTRPPRGEEQDGVAYHFVADETFETMIQDGAFAEWAHVHARRYGTSHGEIQRLWRAGKDIVFDIDVQGAEQLVAGYPDAVSLFILPPSLTELERRLRGRGTDSEDQITLRLRTAIEELRCAERYRFTVINDDLDRAVHQFQAILAFTRAERGLQATLDDETRAVAEACLTHHHTDLIGELLAPIAQG
jgi:guanylate kinase